MEAGRLEDEKLETKSATVSSFLLNFASDMGIMDLVRGGKWSFITS
jgi:hypothetical protein